MKRIIKSSAIVAVAAALISLGGCSKEKLAEMNIDPNNPVEVSPGLILPSAEGALAYTQGGDVSRFVSIFTQHIAGTDRQFVAVQDYVLTETDPDNLWRFNLYGGSMMDLHLMIQQADKKAYNAYAGIGRLLMAYNLMMATDMFGDIPYSDAFKGSEGVKPKYDKQEDIYTSIQTLVAAARTNLTNANPGGQTPSIDDIIYGGDTDKWLKFADVLEARAWLHLAKRSSANYGKALAAIAGKGFTSNADNAVFAFGTTETSASPWYQFTTQRQGYIGFSEGALNTLMDTLTGITAPTVDPRRATYQTLHTEEGMYGKPDFVMPFITFAEQKFIEAECLLANGDAAGAKTAYMAGVSASLDENGVSVADKAAYLANPKVDVATVTLNDIMQQKYIALYTSPEVWTDWRRTGLPALTPNASKPAIPRRMPYPESERLYNKANLPGTPTAFDRLWWDM